MPAMRTFIAAAVVGLSSLPSVIAWGPEGHRIVATLAQSHLDPKVLSAVCSILGSDGNGDAPCHLAAVATWADDNRAPWSAPLHFAEGVSDHPPDDCQFPGADGWVGGERVNALDAIRNVSSILTDFVSGSLSSSSAGGPDEAAAEEALKFLIHFLGDMHHPLHLSGRDRGGNDYKVLWDGGVMRLHKVWDNALVDKAIRSTPANYSKPIPAPALESSLSDTSYDPYIRRIYWEGLGPDQHSGRWGSEADSWLSCPPAPSLESVRMQLEQPPQEVLVGAVPAPRREPRLGNGPPATSDSDTLCPYAWAAPIHALNCAGVVWPPELDEGYAELDTPEYAGKIGKDWVIEKLFMQGGIRLAGILNAIFAPQQ